MFCPVCGKQTAQGAVFCDNCGASLQPLELRQNSCAPARSMAQAQRRLAGYPPRKNRKVLLAALIICGIILAGAAAAAVILLTAGTQVAGFWYSEDRGEAIKFDANNSFLVYSYGEEQEGRYTYDKAKAKGTINVEGEEYAFTLREDEIDVDGIGKFKKADKDFDIKDFLEEAAKAVQTPSPTPEPTPVPTPEVITVINEGMTLTLSFGTVPGKYTGEMVDGLPHGYGIFTSADYEEGGWSYEGDWLAGHMNGMGITDWGAGSYQTGEFSGDYLNGQGSEYWSDALYYEGGFKDGLFHGEGTIYNTHGEIIYSGSWVYGYRAESEEDKNARQELFKEECVSVSCEELYEACESAISIKVVVQGVVLDAYIYEGQSYYCDFLMYEKGVEKKDRIIQVYYHLSEEEAPFIEGQEVTVWGTTEYLYYYTTEGNENLIVPLIEAWSVE